MDCQYAIIDFKLKKMSLRDMHAAGGISNRILYINYGGARISFLEGRGNVNPDAIDRTVWPMSAFERLSIPYRLMDVAELFAQENFDDIVILAPKEILKKSGELNPALKQLCMFYSAFYIAAGQGEQLTLHLCDDDENYCVSKGDFENLAEIQSTPFAKIFYIVKLLDLDYELTPEKINDNLKDNINLFLTDTSGECGGISYTSGRRMYSEFLSVLKGYSEYAWPLCKKDSLIINFTSVSLLSGAIGFYRQDFAEALAEIITVGQKNDRVGAEVISNLDESSRAWREIGRILYKVQIGQNNLDIEAYRRVEIMLRTIEKQEINAMEKLAGLLK